MTWLVLDANAAGRLKADPALFGVTMSPYVLAEIWCNREYRTRILQRLHRFDVRIGLWTADITAALATASLTEIRTFEPFPVTSRIYEQDYDLLTELLDPGRRAGGWASTVKAQGRRFNQVMADASASIRAKIDAGTVEPPATKIGSVEDLLRLFGSSEDSYISSHIHDVVYDGGKRPARHDPHTLLHACLQNPYLRRFFLAEVFYTLATTGWAKDLRLTPPSRKKDDFTDLTLLAYAGDGDVIVTGDKLVRQVVEFLEPDGTVIVRDADDIEASSASRGSA